tara:strand:+ start:341 stop:562 length:222 start_codon:yes stop_codon:yes gene_type:complete
VAVAEVFLRYLLGKQAGLVEVVLVVAPDNPVGLVIPHQLLPLKELLVEMAVALIMLEQAVAELLAQELTVALG